MFAVSSSRQQYKSHMPQEGPIRHRYTFLVWDTASVKLCLLGIRATTVERNWKQGHIWSRRAGQHRGIMLLVGNVWGGRASWRSKRAQGWQQAVWFGGNEDLGQDTWCTAVTGPCWIPLNIASSISQLCHHRWWQAGLRLCPLWPNTNCRNCYYLLKLLHTWCLLDFRWVRWAMLGLQQSMEEAGGPGTPAPASERSHLT